jgi:hypothetical protein
MLDMQALEQALSGIEDLGRAELEFSAGPTPVTLRILTPDEEIAVQRYARQATNHLDEHAHDDEREAAMMEFLDRFKQGVLSYAICQIASLDLRDEPTVATGEKLDSGAQVRIPRHEAVRKLIKRWARPILLACFSKYGDLVERIELQAEKAIQWDPTDLAAEIERLDKRLAELRETQEKQKPPGEDNKVAQQVHSMTEMDRKDRDTTRRVPKPVSTTPTGVSDSPVPDDLPDDEPPVVVTSAPSQAIRQAPVSDPIPHSTPAPPPPNRRSAVPSAGAPARTREAAVPEAPTSYEAEAPDPESEAPAPGPLDIFMDSMSDPNDQNAINAENARLAAARAAQKAAAAEEADMAGAVHEAKIRADALAASKAARHQAEAGGVRPARRKKPPHRAAANVSDAVLDTNAGQVQPVRSTSRPATKGLDTYEMPPTTISGRTKKPHTGEVAVNESVAGGSANPRFKPRR